MLSDINRKNYGMFKTVWCLALGVVLGTASAGQNYGFDPLAFSTTGSFNYPYRLFDPRDAGETGSFPLVIFNHGFGESGTDNTKQVCSHLRQLILTTQGSRITNSSGNPIAPTLAGGAYRAFLLAPQTSSGAAQGILLDGMIEDLCINFPIDRTRIYVTGLSMGGASTWQALGDTPGRFAAGVPLSGNHRRDRVQAIADDAPAIWVIHGDNDNSTGVSNARNIVLDLIAAGHTPRYTEVPGWGHGQWDDVYNPDPSAVSRSYSTVYGSLGGTGDPDDTTTPLYPWLFNQRRPAAKPLLPGELIRVDVGHRSRLTSFQRHGQHWNNFHDATAQGVVAEQVRTGTGRLCAVSISVSGGFAGARNDGIQQTGVFPDWTHADQWRIMNTAAEPGVFTISGLAPGAPYMVRCTGTNRDNDGGRGRVAQYTLTGAGTPQTRDLDASLNLNSAAEFLPQVASENGTLTLATVVSPGSTSRWAHLSAFEISAIPTTFSGWLTEYSLTGSDAAPDADPDGDGIAQLLEYLLGTDPEEADGDASTLTEILSGGFLFEVPISPTAVEGELIVQVSSDLDDWQPVPAQIHAAADGTRSLRYSLAGSGRKMVRVMASYTPTP